MLNAKNISMSYATGTKALIDVSLTVEQEQIYCLLGANGAGKSTLLYLFLDFIKPSYGSTVVDDIVVQENPVEAKRRLAYLPDNVQLYGEMWAIDNLQFFARLAGYNYQPEELLGFFDQVHLDRVWARERVGRFSKGMRQKLGLAIMLARTANTFLLDEPTTGLDPQSSRDLENVLNELRKSGASVLMATHDLLRAQRLADKVGILQSGRLVRELSQSDLTNLDLEETYLQYLDR